MRKRAQPVTLREYQTLGYDRGDKQISKGEFDEIWDYVLGKPHGETFLLEPRDKYLKARNYVGVIQTKNGRVIEILPKIDLAATKEKSETQIWREKEIFLRMLRAWRDGPFRDTGNASVQSLKNFPLLEIFISMFLLDIGKLTRRGLARSYHRVEDNLHVLKGRLLIKDQLQRNLVHAERFYVRYQEFSTNRPVNRLLKSTLLLMHRLSGSANNQSLIKHALYQFEKVPESVNVTADLTRAKVDRTMPLYVRLFPWAKLFLEGSTPTTFHGRSVGFALMFPMEQIFEDYVVHRVRREMGGWNIRAPDKRHYLVERNSNGKQEFRLEPDIVARRRNNAPRLMDAKWKRLAKGERHRGIKQSDLYQLYAYGKKYEEANTQTPLLFLLYPWNEQFTKSMKLDYGGDLRLEVRPVHLHDERKAVFGKPEMAATVPA